MSQSPKQVLMIAYEYPPMDAGGIVRTVNFARYLPRFGWRAHVLTVRNPLSVSRENDAVSWGLVDAEIHRTRSFECENLLRDTTRTMRRIFPISGSLRDGLEWRLRRLWNLLAVPDSKIYWALPAVGRALWIIARHDIRLVYSTSWPFSDHLAGWILHKLTGKPWIADFRDPFLRHLNYGTDARWKHRFNNRLESAICRNARFVISPTDRATQQMRADHPEASQDRFLTIMNGFDAEEFSGDVSPTEKFEILHAGSLYLSRRPAALLQAVQRFLARRPEARDVTRVTLMGAGLDHDLRAYAGYPFVRILGWQPRSRTIEAIRRARVLALLRHPECSTTIPGKTYEYMASGNHILAIIGRQPELAETLEKYGNASVYPPPSVEALAQRLETLFERYRAGNLVPIARTPFVDRFSRIRQAGQLADLCSRIHGQSQPGATPAPEPRRATLTAADTTLGTT